MNLIEIHVDNYKNEMNDNLVDSFMKQLLAVLANEQRYSNCIYFNVRNLHKKTTSSNEVRHKNYKVGGDRIEPNFSLAKSVDTMNKKRKEVSNVVSSHLWCDQLDGVEKKPLK